MMSKRYTVMVVPDRSSRVRRMRVSKRTLWGVVCFLGVLAAAIVASAFHYFSIVDQVRENSHLRKQNLELRNRLVNLHNKVDSIQSILDRVQRFDTKLRAITQLSDPKRHLALGPYAGRTNGEAVFEQSSLGLTINRRFLQRPQVLTGSAKALPTAPLRWSNMTQRL